MNKVLNAQIFGGKNGKKAPKGQLLDEIEEQMRKQEEVHELDIAKLKSEIKILKQQIEISASSHKQHMEELKNNYAIHNRTEIVKSTEKISALEDNYRYSKETLRGIQEELSKIDSIFSRVKNSCQEEIANLSQKKKSLHGINEQLEESIQSIECNKIKKLKKYLRNIKLKHKEEKSFHIESLDKIRKESSVEREYKSRLQEELEQSVVELRKELEELRRKNKGKMHKISSLITETENETDKCTFTLNKVHFSLSDTKNNDITLENTTQAKSQELEQLKNLNSCLRDRASKLNKLIYS